MVVMHFLSIHSAAIKKLSELGIHFIGTGVSGGEEGALKGPSIMPGGQKEAYELVAPIFKEISAKVNGDRVQLYWSRWCRSLCQNGS